MWSNIPDLLHLLLSGHHIGSDELDKLVSIGKSKKEGLYLEVKSGKELEKPGKQSAETIREYTSAFANSSGGILVLGVDESNNWEVDGCPPQGNADLAQWASSCLQHMAASFSPPPNIYMIQHTDGDVLVIAVARSLNLVPVIKAGKPVYFLRLHDQTLEAPDYLMADLLLGKRNHPYLDIVDANIIRLASSPFQDRGKEGAQLTVTMGMRVENSNLVWADEVTMGFISFDRVEDTNFRIGNPLRAYLNLQEINPLKEKGYNDTWCLNLRKGPDYGLKPFADKEMQRKFYLPLRLFGMHFSYKWCAAIYLMSKDSPPIWYQISLVINNSLRDMLRYDEAPALDNKHFKFDKLSGQRPFVGVELLDE